jgi:hypothetical protein
MWGQTSSGATMFPLLALIAQASRLKRLDLSAESEEKGYNELVMKTQIIAECLSKRIGDKI